MVEDWHIFESAAVATYNRLSMIKRDYSVEHMITDRLIQRLAWLKTKPAQVIDLGCGSGYSTHQLTVQFPDAQVTGVDVCQNRLSQAKQDYPDQQFILSDTLKLPFGDHCIDLIVADMVLPWVNDIERWFTEIARVLTVDGVLLFTTLGPNTFHELRDSWRHDDYPHVHEFYDMHDLGDLLVNQRWIDPVTDADEIQIYYSSVKAMCRDLKCHGIQNYHNRRRLGLIGKQRWQVLENNYQQYQRVDAKLPLTFEVVYGHAIAPGRSKSVAEDGCVYVPVSDIGILG